MILRDISQISNLNFRLLDKFSSKSAGRKAATLWLTPPLPEQPIDEAGLLSESKRDDIRFSGGSNATQNHTVARYTWGDGRDTVLLLHDWGKSAAQVARLAQALSHEGYRVITFDAVAHGASSGAQTHVLETTEIIKCISREEGPFHAVIAHSVSAISAVLAIQEGTTTRKLVLSNTAASIDFYLREFCRQISISRPTMGRMSYYINTCMGRNLKEFSIVNLVPRLTTAGLILHDKYNDIVDYREALTLSKVWRNSDLRLTEGFDHDDFLAHPDIVRTILSYLKVREPAAQLN